MLNIAITIVIGFAVIITLLSIPWLIGSFIAGKNAIMEDKFVGGIGLILAIIIILFAAWWIGWCSVGFKNLWH